MEQQMTTIGRLLEGREFESLDDVNAYLHEALAKGAGHLRGSRSDSGSP
jgi:hypothetical protein